jgi:F0F1-type ATP synthase assembly protein I
LTPISDDEHKTRRSELQERLGALAKTKREMWEKVHEQTIAMTCEIARELVVKILEPYRRSAL